MGEWVLERACRQTQAWRHAPQPGRLTVSVNLSGRQIAQSDLVRGGQRAGRKRATAISAGARDHRERPDARRRVRHHRRSGPQGPGRALALDDFGTGYSSLSYLKKFPVDVLKIDRSFVDGLGTEGEDSAIVRAIISLAESLGLETVAEGTETPIQVTALRELGCEKAQGYLFSRPQPPAAIIDFLVDSLASARALLAT